jgi:hypothetical protein
VAGLVVVAVVVGAVVAGFVVVGEVVVVALQAPANNKTSMKSARATEYMFLRFRLIPFI